MTMTWTPPSTAWGSNLVCYTPIDSLGQQGNTQCVTYLVGVNGPELIYTSYVNGTMVREYYDHFFCLFHRYFFSSLL